jgi:hypothetical protein
VRALHQTVQVCVKGSQPISINFCAGVGEGCGCTVGGEVVGLSKVGVVPIAAVDMRSKRNVFIFSLYLPRNVMQPAKNYKCCNYNDDPRTHIVK